jgi:hypothetical protein
MLFEYKRIQTLENLNLIREKSSGKYEYYDKVVENYAKEEIKLA